MIYVGQVFNLPALGPSKNKGEATLHRHGRCSSAASPLRVAVDSKPMNRTFETLPPASSFTRRVTMRDKGKIRPAIDKVFLLATSLAAIIVTIVPIGTDPMRRAWLRGLLILAGLIILTCVFRYPYRAGLPRADALLTLVLFLVGLLSSGGIDYSFAGGDAYHSYRGFPFRWLVGSLNPDMGKTYEWSLFWPGLLIDGFCWFAVALSITLLLRQLRSLLIMKGSSCTGC